MPKESLSSPKLYEPPGGGFFSQAFVVSGGKTVYVSGMTARDENGELVGDGDIAAQTVQVLENMKAVVEAAGGSMADVVKLTIFMQDVSQLQQIRDIRARYFSKPFPASTVVEISRLADERFLIEIEAVAVIG